ncbi:hypothetical protein BBF96_06525 [Anoxybacter fermentans]|uniref:Uncharacterized protein n=1 Tax=Anoxybacter fermentans TaxID=1323375 RepID=A0A3Q9HQ77_9FIRM|nr:hypothetical protein [Anoxybacter fermentans]AZR73069.1 hypothetical protein BBF96_06525 [Anoxybacter fermentans]
MNRSFVEVSVYQVKPDMTKDFENLISEMKDYLNEISDFNDFKVMKRTHRIKDYDAIKNGEPPVRLKRITKSVKYVIYWELADENMHGKVTQVIFGKYRKRLNKLLIVPEDKFLGERII